MKAKADEAAVRTGGVGLKMSFLVVILFALFLMSATGCALNQAEVRQIWKNVAAEYPGCRVPPKVVELNDGTLGGRYVPAQHTVYIDRYAADSVWEHEFRHACGDALGEAPVSTATALAQAYPRW